MEQVVPEAPLRRVEALGFRPRLWEHQLELITLPHDHVTAGLGRDAHPVHTGRNRDRPVGLDRHLETEFPEGLHQRGVQLQQWLATGADQQRTFVALGGSPTGDRAPGLGGSGGKVLGSCEHATAGTIGAHEVGVAELADSAGAVRLASRPQVAAREPAEHGAATRVQPLTLKGVEQLLDAVGHVRAPRSASDRRSPPPRSPGASAGMLRSGHTQHRASRGRSNSRCASSRPPAPSPR